MADLNLGNLLHTPVPGQGQQQDNQVKNMLDNLDPNYRHAENALKQLEELTGITGNNAALLEANNQRTIVLTAKDPATAAATIAQIQKLETEAGVVPADAIKFTVAGNKISFNADDVQTYNTKHHEAHGHHGGILGTLIERQKTDAAAQNVAPAVTVTPALSTSTAATDSSNTSITVPPAPNSAIAPSSTISTTTQTTIFPGLDTNFLSGGSVVSPLGLNNPFENLTTATGVAPGTTTATTTAQAPKPESLLTKIAESTATVYPELIALDSERLAKAGGFIPDTTLSAPSFPATSVPSVLSRLTDPVLNEAASKAVTDIAAKDLEAARFHISELTGHTATIDKNGMIVVQTANQDAANELYSQLYKARANAGIDPEKFPIGTPGTGQLSFDPNKMAADSFAKIAIEQANAFGNAGLDTAAAITHNLKKNGIEATVGDQPLNSFGVADTHRLPSITVKDPHGELTAKLLEFAQASGVKGSIVQANSEGFVLDLDKFDPSKGGIPTRETAAQAEVLKRLSEVVTEHSPTALSNLAQEVRHEVNLQVPTAQQTSKHPSLSAVPDDKILAAINGIGRLNMADVDNNRQPSAKSDNPGNTTVNPDMLTILRDAMLDATTAVSQPLVGAAGKSTELRR